MTQIDFVEEPVEQLRLAAEVFREGLERLLLAGSLAAADDDDHVLVFAELSQVTVPAFLIVLAGVDEVAALRVVDEPGAKSVDGGGAEAEGNDQRHGGPTADERDQADQQTDDGRGRRLPLRGIDLFRMY